MKTGLSAACVETLIAHTGKTRDQLQSVADVGIDAIKVDDLVVAHNGRLGKVESKTATSFIVVWIDGSSSNLFAEYSTRVGYIGNNVVDVG